MNTLVRIIAICSIALPLISSAQQTTLAKFIISDATRNKVDITETYLKTGGYMVFYTVPNDGLYMANIMRTRNTQSYGRLYATETSKSQTYEGNPADIFTFKWRYQNSYDSRTGTASIELIKIYKPQGVTFSCIMILENLDVFTNKGYMDGTVDFSRY